MRDILSHVTPERSNVPLSGFPSLFGTYYGESDYADHHKTTRLYSLKKKKFGDEEPSQIFQISLTFILAARLGFLV